MRLTGTTAIVTGGGRGIGRAIALGLTREGCDLVIAARSEDEVAAVSGEIRDLGGSVLGMCLDLADAASASLLVAAAVKRFGSVGILVNNAGVLIEHDVPDVTLEEWDRTMAVNVRAAFLLSQLALAQMKPSRSGYIINISSPAARDVRSHLAAYGVSKAAVAALGQALFHEAKGHGIKVSTVYPGFVDTAMLRGLSSGASRASQAALPDDIAECVLFLLKQSDRVVVRDLMAFAFQVD